MNWRDDLDLKLAFITFVVVVMLATSFLNQIGRVTP